MRRSNVQINSLGQSLKKLLDFNGIQMGDITPTANGISVSMNYNQREFMLRIESPANNQVAVWLDGVNIIPSRIFRTEEGVVTEPDVQNIAAEIISKILQTGDQSPENSMPQITNNSTPARFIDQADIDPNDTRKKRFVEQSLQLFEAEFANRSILVYSKEFTINSISMKIGRAGAATYSFVVSFYSSDVFCDLDHNHIAQETVATSGNALEKGTIERVVNAVEEYLRNSTAATGSAQLNIAPSEVKRVEAMQNLLENFRGEFQSYGFDMISSEVTYNGILMNVRRGDGRANKVGVQFHGLNVYCSMNGEPLNHIVTDKVFTLNRLQILEILDAVMGKLISDHPSNEGIDDFASVTGRAYLPPGRPRPVRQRGAAAGGGDRFYDVEQDDSSADDMAARGRAAGALDTKAFFQMMLRLLNIVVGDDKTPLDSETIRILRQIMDAIRLATGPT